MRLLVLTDNNTFIDQYYLGEPAACYYLEDEGEKILFDLGYSDVFIKNAQAMGLDLNDVSAIAVSHGHNDHIRGAQWFVEGTAARKTRFIAHPDAFKKRFEHGVEIGCPLDASFFTNNFATELSKEPVRITKNITFLGEIPSYNDFERQRPIGMLHDENGMREDFVLDDTALVYNGDNGLFIITGCSHSGICNILEHAKKVCGKTNIAGVIGGLHLLDVSEQLHKTIRYFKENAVGSLYPCHCVSFTAKAEIHKHIPVKEVGVGLEIAVQ